MKISNISTLLDLLNTGTIIYLQLAFSIKDTRIGVVKSSATHLRVYTTDGVEYTEFRIDELLDLDKPTSNLLQTYIDTGYLYTMVGDTKFFKLGDSIDHGCDLDSVGIVSYSGDVGCIFNKMDCLLGLDTPIKYPPNRYKHVFSDVPLPLALRLQFEKYIELARDVHELANELVLYMDELQTALDVLNEKFAGIEIIKPKFIIDKKSIYDTVGSFILNLSSHALLYVIDKDTFNILMDDLKIIYDAYNKDEYMHDDTISITNETFMDFGSEARFGESPFYRVAHHFNNITLYQDIRAFTKLSDVTISKITDVLGTDEITIDMSDKHIRVMCEAVEGESPHALLNIGAETSAINEHDIKEFGITVQDLVNLNIPFKYRVQ